MALPLGMQVGRADAGLRERYAGLGHTPDGWVHHGQDRSSADHAMAVAKLLAQRLGWETVAGSSPPPPRPPREGAPTARVAAKSPAPLRGATRPPRPAVVTPLKTGPSKPSALEEEGPSERYLEELATFALEAQLRDFLIAHLSRLSIGGTALHLYRDSNGRTGREYPTGVGPIDILAIAPDGTLFVIELKLDRGPDRALGQLARYVGWTAPAETQLPEDLAGQLSRLCR